MKAIYTLFFFLSVLTPSAYAKPVIHDGDKVEFFVDEFIGGQRWCLGTVTRAFTNGTAMLDDTLPAGCAQSGHTYKLDRLLHQARVVQLVDQAKVGTGTAKVGGFAFQNNNPLSYGGYPCVLQITAITSGGSAIFSSVAQDGNCGAKVGLYPIKLLNVGGGSPFAPVDFVQEARTHDGRVVRVGDYASVDELGTRCSGRVKDVLSNGFARIGGGDCAEGRWFSAKELNGARQVSAPQAAAPRSQDDNSPENMETTPAF